MKGLRAGAVLVATLLLAAPALGQTNAPPSQYTEVFYPSGNLRIQAYLYTPEGQGRFPVVIYNHGSREGRERQSFAFPHIGSALTRAGYIVLVPERRGYGKSDGAIWWQEAANDPARLIGRLQAETDDVLAALEFLRTVASADNERIGIMGWSFGGIVTMLTRLAEIFGSRGVPHRLVVYEPFLPRERAMQEAAGHALFSAQGLSRWESDVVQFLNRYLTTEKP